MGCMIHCHIEVKKDNTWYHFAQPRLERDYNLWHLMSNLDRGMPSELPPICHHDGLPEDVSFVTKTCFEQDKDRYHLHDIGWLEDKDLKELQETLCQLNPHVKRTGIDELDLEHSIFRCYVNGSTLSSHPGWDDLRVVFWFDN